jgi:DNA repair exonuclease SbcCD ATPase subunit
VPQKLSLAALRREREELQKDLTAFKKSYEAIRARVDESLNCARSYPPLHKWSGTRAVMGSLEMVIQHIEKCLEEYGQALHLIQIGEIENSDDEDKPVLGVLEGGEYD